jgi:hypothetical protein
MIVVDISSSIGQFSMAQWCCRGSIVDVFVSFPEPKMRGILEYLSSPRSWDINGWGASRLQVKAPRADALNLLIIATNPSIWKMKYVSKHDIWLFFSIFLLLTFGSEICTPTCSQGPSNRQDVTQARKAKMSTAFSTPIPQDTQSYEPINRSGSTTWSLNFSNYDMHYKSIELRFCEFWDWCGALWWLKLHFLDFHFRYWVYIRADVMSSRMQLEDMTVSPCWWYATQLVCSLQLPIIPAFQGPCADHWLPSRSQSFPRAKIRH